MPKDLKHILVIRGSAMGDVAMTVPVIKAFTEQYPEIKITILTRKFFKPFFRSLDNVTVFAIDVKGKHKGLLGLYKLSREIKQLKIDAVADLHNVLRTKILKSFINGINFIQVDKGRAEKKALVSGVNFQQLKLTHQRYVDVFKKLGYQIDLSKPTFPAPSSLNEKTQSVVKRNQNKSIGIAPFAAFKSKTYALELIEKIIIELAKDYNILLFGGGEQEIIQLENLTTLQENVVNVAGKFSLDEELDLISNLDLMISMDSGNGHIAAMLGVKVITVWGVTHPFAGFSPFNQPKEYSLTVNREQFPLIPTSIYGNKFPKGYETAINTISPMHIVDKVKSII